MEDQTDAFVLNSLLNEAAGPNGMQGYETEPVAYDQDVPDTFEILFEKWMLPIKLVVDTYPTPGRYAKRLFLDWVHTTRLVITVPQGLTFPFVCKAFRRPMALGPAKRTNGPDVDMKNPRTWPADARWGGVEHPLIPYGAGIRALCTHNPKCPPTLDFPGGIILDADSAWVMCHDRQIQREEDYIARKREEAEAIARMSAGQKPLPTKAAIALVKEQPMDPAAKAQLAADAAVKALLKKQAAKKAEVEVEEDAQESEG